MEKRKTPRNNFDSRSRLKEIISVLSRREIVKGITPEKLRLIIEDLGPTFVKLGQIMSMRQDVLPAEYCRELTKLRADVAPMSHEEVQDVIEQQYGRTLSSVFKRFDPVPLGSASIAQAHSAMLKNGAEVVVKVQRPGIHDTMAMDIALLKRASGILKLASGTGNVLDFRAILDEMWFVAQQEMDFMIEAQNADEFYELNKDVAYITCPRILHEFTTSKVLVMEYVDGIELDEQERLAELGYDLKEIAVKLADNYVKQIIDDAFFHADPHPGNIRIRDGKIVWLDLGMMGRLTARDQALFKKAVKAVAEGDVSELKNVLLALGVHTGKINHAKLYTDIDDMLTRYGTMEVGSMDVGVLMEELVVLARSNQIAMPKGVTMLCRGIITVEGVLCQLDPNINMVEIMANRMSSEFLQDFDPMDELKANAKILAYSSKKALGIPGQISDILKMAIKGQSKLNLELTGSEEPLAAIDKMINKIVVCIITAALLIGSSLICTTNMQPKILGIPALGILGFIVALILSVWLVVATRKKR